MLDKKELEIHLLNFKFAIDHCVATKKDFQAMENSLETLANILLAEEPKENKPDEKA